MIGALLVAALAAATTGATAEESPTAGRSAVVTTWDTTALARIAPSAAPTRVAGPRLEGAPLELELQPMAVVGPETRFIVAGPDGERPLDFDPARVRLYRGSVVGHPGSRVFLALGQRVLAGRFDLGGGRGSWLVSRSEARGDKLGAEEVAVFRPTEPAGGAPGVPACGVDALGDEAAGAVAMPVRAAAGAAGIRQIELAVETDFEFASLFPDLDAAAEYLVALYGAVSDIYLRDVGAYVRLNYVRLWDNPRDLFNQVDPTPLFDLRDHWNATMAHVERDAVQLLSGRRDYPFGGQAFVGQLCGANGYSVVGYALGFFPDPSRPSPFHYDVHVTAHELGHTSGTLHTHDAPYHIDTCDDPTTRPQRGTIMSYCDQTWSGQGANIDLYFHTGIRRTIRAHLEAEACIAADCDQNGVDDAVDVEDAGVDADGNGVPDRCEDCNANSLPDGQETELDPAIDLDVNAVPDACEPDCNANARPDALDIVEGRAFDLYGDGVPDVCQADCDGDAIADYNRIQSDMRQDIDRDAVLDACQDCDGDGVTDLEALGGAHDLWIASGLPGQPIREFHAASGVLVRSSVATVERGQDVIAAPTGEMWVSGGPDGRVAAFDRMGRHVRDVVPAGGVLFAAGLLVHGDRLLVAARGSHSVEAFAFDGTPLGPFVAAGAGGLTAPFGLARDARGHVFVTSNPGMVLEYGADGTYLRVLVHAERNAGLAEPRGLTFKPDGNLLVASFGTNEVLEYDGRTGMPLGPWARVGTATRLTRISPWGVRVGPTGNVFVSRTGEAHGSPPDPGRDHDHEDDVVGLHLTNAQVYEFDVRNGNFLRTHVGGNDHGLRFPTGFDFVPGWSVDCDRNLLPDTCDAAVAGVDDDASGVPDACEADCNGNGRLDRLDVLPYGPALDCNANLIPDACDVDGGASPDCNLDGRPDECELLDVERLDFEGSFAAGADVIRWMGRGPGAVYDVAGGSIAELREGASLAAGLCLASGLTEPFWASSERPPAGEGVWVLVRSRTACGSGSWGRDSAGVERNFEACP